MMAGKLIYRHLEKSYPSSLFSIVYNVILRSLCEHKRDLFYFLHICNASIS